MTYHLKRRMLKSRQEAYSRVGLLTHILDKSVDNLENLRSGGPSLVVGESF